MSKMETFDRTAGLLLEQLLQAFPEQLRIDLRKLDIEAKSPPSDEILDGAMEFLIREGFVTGRKIADGVPFYGNVQLTVRSLTLLRQVPDSVKQKVTWGERLAEGARSTAKDALGVVTRQFLEFAADRAGLKGQS